MLNCLETINRQNFSKDKFEVIIIDDHSEDKTFKLVDDYCKLNPNFSIVKLFEGEGKKAAHATLFIFNVSLFLFDSFDEQSVA